MDMPQIFTETLQFGLIMQSVTLMGGVYYVASIIANSDKKGLEA